MTTLKEFKEWLEQFPEDTIIKIANYDREYVPFDIINGEKTQWEFIDFSEQFIPESSGYFNKKILFFGEE